MCNGLIIGLLSTYRPTRKRYQDEIPKLNISYFCKSTKSNLNPFSFWNKSNFQAIFGLFRRFKKMPFSHFFYFHWLVLFWGAVYLTYQTVQVSASQKYMVFDIEFSEIRKFMPYRLLNFIFGCLGKKVQRTYQECL